jgi:hypothetical protein
MDYWVKIDVFILSFYMIPAKKRSFQNPGPGRKSERPYE